MLKLPQTVVVRCNPMNKKFYEEKGYNCPKVKEEFEVNVEDLQSSSRTKVFVECDYCGKEFLMYMYAYTQSIKNSNKLACNCCKNKKTYETIKSRYGVENSMQIPEIREKAKQTLIERYGVDSPSRTKQHQEAMKTYDKNIALQHYIDTCVKKYGVTNTSKLPSTIEKMKNTCVEKYGGESSQCSPEIRKKSYQTLLSDGKIPSSKSEQQMVALIKNIYGEENCTPQYIFDRCCFDCLLNFGNIKIDIEYDGRYWHDLKKGADIRRDFYTIKNGFKVLRFRSETEIPTKEQIIECVNYLVNSSHDRLVIEL